MNELSRYIDCCIVKEYTTVDDDIFDLDITRIPKNELSHLIDFAINHDQKIKDSVLSRLQEIIDERVCEYRNYITHDCYEDYYMEAI